MVDTRIVGSDGKPLTDLRLAWHAAACAQTPRGTLVMLADSHNKPLLPLLEGSTSVPQLASETVERAYSRFATNMRSHVTLERL